MNFVKWTLRIWRQKSHIHPTMRWCKPDKIYINSCDGRSVTAEKSHMYEQWEEGTEKSGKFILITESLFFTSSSLTVVAAFHIISPFHLSLFVFPCPLLAFHLFSSLTVILCLSVSFLFFPLYLDFFFLFPIIPPMPPQSFLSPLSCPYHCLFVLLGLFIAPPRSYLSL